MVPQQQISFPLVTCLRFSIFLFLITPPPPRSTLFPYTTLFRSRGDGGRGRANPALAARPGRRLPRRAVRRDRKSTRLNSSHVSISYAVFCLKKKNKKAKYSANCVPHPEWLLSDRPHAQYSLL